ncbi:hypothetical protein [Martelella endophytica]|uniref:hypothetical protein n=1 Tax=Martelella endophytica TaxID=1486262 RepID=UPI000AF0CC6C|nr:hypothetical protein [Martelella endophytica]
MHRTFPQPPQTVRCSHLPGQCAEGVAQRKPVKNLSKGGVFPFSAAIKPDKYVVTNYRIFIPLILNDYFEQRHVFGA